MPLYYEVFFSVLQKCFPNIKAPETLVQQTELLPCNCFIEHARFAAVFNLRFSIFKSNQAITLFWFCFYYGLRLAEEPNCVFA